MGLHKGEVFHKWLQLATQHSAATTEGLLQHMRLGANGITLFQRESDGQYKQLLNSEVEWWTTDGDVDPEAGRHHYPLRIVASEVATQSMIIFPRDADLFYVSSHASGRQAIVVSVSNLVFTCQCWQRRLGCLGWHPQGAVSPLLLE
jgi:hypothetical protein